MITAALLREAATHLSPDGSFASSSIGEKFMCFCIANAARDAFSVAEEYDINQEFQDLLGFHGVSPTGALDFYRADGTYAYGSHIGEPHERQAVRFDFLNLLAESLDAEQS